MEMSQRRPLAFDEAVEASLQQALAPKATQNTARPTHNGSAACTSYHPVGQHEVACVHLAAAVTAVKVKWVAVPAEVGGPLAVWNGKHGLRPLTSHRMAGEQVLQKGGHQDSMADSSSASRLDLPLAVAGAPQDELQCKVTNACRCVTVISASSGLYLRAALLKVPRAIVVANAGDARCARYDSVTANIINERDAAPRGWFVRTVRICPSGCSRNCAAKISSRMEEEL